MRFRGEGVKNASEVVVRLLRENEGLGGVIVLDSDGNCQSFLPNLHLCISLTRCVQTLYR